VDSVIPRLVEACLSRGFLLRLKVLVGDGQTLDAPLPQADATLQSCLEHFVDKEADAQLYGFASDLLSSKEPREVLERAKKELGIGG
jgi:hypothetical protein